MRTYHTSTTKRAWDYLLLLCIVLIGMTGIFWWLQHKSGREATPSQARSAHPPQHTGSVLTAPATSLAKPRAALEQMITQPPAAPTPAQAPIRSAAPTLSGQAASDLLPPSPGGWIKTFADNFDAPTLDPAKWSTGFGWGPYDSNAWVASCAVPSQVSVDAGRLVLSNSPIRPSTQECSRGKKAYSSAAVNTKNKFAQEFGYFEARIQMPGKRGTMGAWWTHRNDGQWPPEIDVAEVLGGKANQLHMAVHYQDPAQRGNHSTGRVTPTADLSVGFHIYGVDWQPQQVVFYLDGMRQGSINARDGATFQRGPSYLILNTVVCTSALRYWCETPDAGTLWDDATRMRVDWIRVWKRQSNQ